MSSPAVALLNLTMDLVGDLSFLPVGVQIDIYNRVADSIEESSEVYQKARQKFIEKHGPFTERTFEALLDQHHGVKREGS